MPVSKDACTRIALKYGLNPTQHGASLYAPDGNLPVQILSGTPSFINMLDALRGWKLVRELRRRFERPAAASFKHVNPAGVGLAGTLGAGFLDVHFLQDARLSPLAEAYLRARQADRIASYGDFVALSDPVDLETATILAQVASDGVIAPGFASDALDMLRRKRGGRYLVLAIDPAYEPAKVETRTEFGLELTQETEDAEVPDLADGAIVSQASDLSQSARDDLLLATIVARHTQSNAVVIAKGGQTIGIGAGQQSRIAATDLACRKADSYRLLFHPRFRELALPGAMGRIERMNLVDQLVRFDELDDAARHAARVHVPDFVPLTSAERSCWLRSGATTSLVSDAFIPFSDNVDRAVRSGVTHIAQTGGSMRDAEVTGVADAHGVVMIHSGRRYFLH